MNRGILYGLLWFGSMMFYNYAIIILWLDYPLIPAITTNNYWELIRINMELLGWVLVLLIPTVLLAVITTAIVAGIDIAISLLWIYATSDSEPKDGDSND